MKKLALLFLLPMSLLAQAPTYVVTPGGTYPTFHALMAAKTLAAGNIVEFQAASPGGYFDDLEPSQMTPNGNGSAGNPIILRGRTGDTVLIDGALSINSCFSANGRSYITLQNLQFGYATGNASAECMIDAVNIANFTVTNCTIFVSLADAATANTDTERGGIIQSGANFTMTGTVIWILPGTWGSDQTDCADIGCQGGFIQNCTFHMLNSSLGGSYGSLGSAASGHLSSVVHTGGNNYALNDVEAVGGGLYGTIQVTGVTAGAITSFSVLTNGTSYLSGSNQNLTAITGSGTGGAITIANGGAGHNDCLQLTNSSNLTVDGCVMDRTATNASNSTSGQALIAEFYNETSDAAPTNYGYFTMTNCLMYGNFGSNGATINSRYGSGFHQDGICAITFSNNTIDCLGNISGAVPMNVTCDGGGSTAPPFAAGIFSGGSLVFQNNLIINRQPTVSLGGGIVIGCPYGSTAYAGTYLAGTVLGSMTSSSNHLYYTGTSSQGGGWAATNVCTIPGTSPTLASGGAGTGETWATWVTDGYDTNGIGYNTPGYSATWQDPMLVAPAIYNYILQSGSPDRAKGVVNSSTPLIDNTGRYRPNSVSIGAFEYWLTGISALAQGHAFIQAGP